MISSEIVTPDGLDADNLMELKVAELVNDKDAIRFYNDLAFELLKDYNDFDEVEELPWIDFE